MMMSESNVANHHIRKAVESFQSSNYSACCAHFCVAFKLSPHLCDTWKGTFLFAIDKHVKHLEDQLGRDYAFDVIVSAFQQAIEAMPQSEDLEFNLASFYYK